MLQRGRGHGAGHAATARKGSELDLVVGNEAVGAVSGEPRERIAVAWDPWWEPEAGIGSRGCSAVDGRGRHVNGHGRGQASEADGREGGISETGIPLPPRGRGGRGMSDQEDAIVSQCTASSGCERNWSTFALIHTQVRNRLGYEKLDKLVYVHYNLQLRVQQIEGQMKEIGENEELPLDDNAAPRRVLCRKEG